MGREQVGLLPKGPVKITARQIKAAVRACKRHRQELLNDAGAGATQDERCDAAESETGERFDPLVIPEDPTQAIREFVDWWHDLDCGDSCSRIDPDDPQQKIVYAGDMTYGDEPDGYGYQMIKKGHSWGFTEALGIR